MGRTVAVVNQKGGVGKTTVTLGLASAAWAAGQRVLVVDMDPQASTTWVLGIDPESTEASSADLLAKHGAVTPLASTWGDNIEVIPGAAALQGLEHGSGKAPEQRLRTALAPLIGSYDVVFIDCPPSLGNLTLNALTAAQHVLIVSDPAALGLRGIANVADLIDSVWESSNPELDLAGVIVNKMPAVSAEADRRYDELSRSVGKKAVWQPAIPNRVIVNQAIAERRPIHSYGYKAQDITEVFDKLWAKLRKKLKAEQA
jgi:cellulose biosynthesis protein BcsQ